jgi:hypothetical protein
MDAVRAVAIIGVFVEHFHMTPGYVPARREACRPHAMSTQAQR